jgi:hypothetical protein
MLTRVWMNRVQGNCAICVTKETWVQVWKLPSQTGKPTSGRLGGGGGGKTTTEWFTYQE